MIPERLRSFLPPDTASKWEVIQPAVPAAAYLAGGRAITAHLCHRISQDLDFFFDDDVDLDALAAALGELGPFAVTARTNGTLIGLFSRTRIQFLDACRQNRVDDELQVAGLRVASMRDLVAMKLEVVGDRGELRDYFDLMAIEQAGRGTAEAGLGDYLARYQPTDANASLSVVAAPPDNEKPPRKRGLSEGRLMGLEPTTSCMASRRSSQLSYSRIDGKVYRTCRIESRRGGWRG